MTAAPTTLLSFSAKWKRCLRAARCRSTWRSSRFRLLTRMAIAAFGVGVECTLTAAKYAHQVVAQVNAQMPRTYGDSFIHVSEIDSIVELSRPLCELKPQPSNRTFEQIGARVASLIEDGAVLQCGIGAIPDCDPAQPDGPQGPRRTHRDDLRQCDTADRSRRHQRAAQELEAAQNHSGLRAGHAEAVRLHRRKSGLRIPSLGLHQRSFPHRR